MSERQTAMASVYRAVTDSFKNLVANLGTGRDKQAHGQYYLTTLTDDVLSAIYRVSWMGRKIVDIPANDATRRWREWNAEADQIEAIENEEKRLKLQQKTKKAIQYARLYGGSALYFSITGDDPALPLEIERVRKDQLGFITVLDRKVLVPGDIDLDPISETYGLPMWYEITSSSVGAQRIHPTRLALFTGNDVLIDIGSIAVTQGWGDSVLQSAYEAVRNADSIASNIASLVYEAKIDVLQIPDLQNIMTNERSRTALEQRVVLSAQLKGNNGMLIVDGEEDYSQKQFTFGGLTDIAYQALQSVSGAADIPLTRFLGQSPAGLSSTGESDLRNYYDAVNSMQALTITPTLERLDEALIRSALGDRPADISYVWASLWQMSDDQKSQISKQTAETIDILAKCGLFNENDLAPAAANLLIEHSILPSFEITEESPDDIDEGADDAALVIEPNEEGEEDDDAV